MKQTQLIRLYWKKTAVLRRGAVDKGQTICNCDSIFKSASFSIVQVEREDTRVLVNRKEVRLMGDLWQRIRTREARTITKRKCMWRESSRKEILTRPLNSRVTSCG